MKPSDRFIVLFLLMFFVSAAFAGTEKQITPVTPKASPEATALLNLFYSISGKYIFTGQHNYPNIGDRNTLFAADVSALGWLRGLPLNWKAWRMIM